MVTHVFFQFPGSAKSRITSIVRALKLPGTPEALQVACECSLGLGALTAVGTHQSSLR